MTKLLHLAAFIALLPLNFYCAGQPTATQPPPFKHLSFTAPDPAVQAELLIPYLEGNLYGICNYQGKVLLKPGFEDIEMPQSDLGYFLAKRNGRWSLYDVQGNQVLPCDYPSMDAMRRGAEMLGNDFTGVDHYLTSIRDAAGGYLKPVQKEGVSGSDAVVEVPRIEKDRYFFLHKSTRQPFRSWFLPDHEHLHPERYSRFGSAFNRTALYGFLKVMTEDGLFTLLDREGNPVVEPNWNCTSLSPTKVMLFHPNGFCALRDLKTGSQTDFLFHEVETTVSPDLCRGKTYADGKVRYYKIDAAGNATLLPNEYAWTPLDERYSVVLKDPAQYPWIWLLQDEQTGLIVRELPSNRVTAFYPGGVAIVKDGEAVAVQTTRGDTLDLPPYPGYKRANDSLYIFFDGDETGIADRQHRELYRLKDGKIDYAGFGSFRLEKDKRIGWVGPGGKLLFPPEYDRILPVQGTNCLIVTQNGLSGLYAAADGREILPLRYRHLAPNGGMLGQGAGFELRDGEDLFIFTPDLEIILQKTDNPIVTKSDFQIGKNAPEAAKRDFEQASIPRFFTPYLLSRGPNWLHIFHCDGQYVRSLEGYSGGENLLLTRHEQVHGTDGTAQTGVARIKDPAGKTCYVRLEDGFVYKK